MARENNPLEPLRKISKPLLREYFSRAAVLGQLSWDDPKAVDAEAIYAAMRELDAPVRASLQRALEDIDEMSDADGSRALSEDILRGASNKVAEFKELQKHGDRAMWAYLHLPKIFERAAAFAEAAHLARGRSWVKRNGLPVPTPDRPFVTTEEMKDSLGKALTAFHSKELRGDGCTVRPLTRADGAEYFFASLDDYPYVVPVWRDGKIVDGLAVSRFAHTFVYTPKAGTLEISAAGGKRVHGPLHTIFGKAIFGIDLPITDPIKPAYELRHLMKRSRVLRTDPLDPVDSPRLTRLILEPIDHPSEPITVEADPDRGPDRIDDVLDRLLRDDVRSFERWRVIGARFHLNLKPAAKKRHPTMQFSVSQHHCDLRSRPDEVRAWGERTLALSGVSFG